MCSGGGQETSGGSANSTGRGMGDAGGAGGTGQPLPPYDGPERPETGTGGDLPPTSGGSQPPRNDTPSGVSTTGSTRSSKPRQGGTKKYNVGSGLNM